MTRSIFDPTGDDTERSGSTFTPPDADQHSHMPEEVTDGVADDDDDAEDETEVTPPAP